MWWMEYMVIHIMWSVLVGMLTSGKMLDGAFFKLGS